MRTRYIIGLSAVTLFIWWAFVTKNEVVRGIMQPIKLKLGLIKDPLLGSDALVSPGNVNKLLTDKLLLSGDYPDVHAVGGNAEGIVIGLMPGMDHSKIKKEFAGGSYGGVKLSFVETPMAEAL